ncbi:hypothetical protein V6N11_030539 [Hibiscus sabdariffa]|uniref:Uncharacterized protein n=1 Tax=Hibiscus sabdariffa TaxID=183260 RepID=A0ABR2N796_9ROSI
MIAWIALSGLSVLLYKPSILSQVGAIIEPDESIEHPIAHPKPLAEARNVLLVLLTFSLVVPASPKSKGKTPFDPHSAKPRGSLSVCKHVSVSHKVASSSLKLIYQNSRKGQGIVLAHLIIRKISAQNLGKVGWCRQPLCITQLADEMQSDSLRGIELMWITGSMVQEVELVRVPMVEGGNTREECERESVGVKGDGSVERRAGGSVPVVTVDSGTEEEEISASCISPRWQENKIWEDDGAVLALAGDGESGSVSMPAERVGMVSREAEVERGMADGRVVAAAVDASELAGRSNLVEEIECYPILLVVWLLHKIRDFSQVQIQIPNL